MFRKERIFLSLRRIQRLVAVTTMPICTFAFSLSSAVPIFAQEQFPPHPRTGSNCILEQTRRALKLPNVSRGLKSRLPEKTLTLLEMQNEIVPRVETKGISARNDLIERHQKAMFEDYRKKPNLPHPAVAFFETMDQEFRSNPIYPSQLLQQALNRLPHLESGMNVVVSGEGGARWAAHLKKEAQNRGIDLSIIQVPGSLSNQINRHGKNFIGDFPPEVKARLRTHPSVFFDDTYSTGNTAKSVRSAIEIEGGRFDGTFVIYAPLEARASALYRSTRPTPIKADPSPIFTPPAGWSWAQSEFRLGIEINDLLEMNRNDITAPAAKLLLELNRLKAPVALLQNGKRIPMPTGLKRRFPDIEDMPLDELPDLLLGSYAKKFAMEGQEIRLARALQDIPLLNVGFDDWNPTVVVGQEPTYFLDRLSEIGILRPETSPRKTAAARPQTPKIYDLSTNTRFPWERWLKLFEKDQTSDVPNWKKAHPSVQQRFLTLLSRKDELIDKTLELLEEISAYGPDARFLPTLNRLKFASDQRIGELRKAGEENRALDEHVKRAKLMAVIRRFSGDANSPTKNPSEPSGPRRTQSQ